MLEIGARELNNIVVSGVFLPGGRSEGSHVAADRISWVPDPFTSDELCSLQVIIFFYTFFLNCFIYFLPG